MEIRDSLIKLVEEEGLEQLKEFVRAPYLFIKWLLLYLESLVLLDDEAKKCIKSEGCADTLLEMVKELLDVEPYELSVPVSKIVELYKTPLATLDAIDTA